MTEFTILTRPYTDRLTGETLHHGVRHFLIEEYKSGYCWLEFAEAGHYADPIAEGDGFPTEAEARADAERHCREQDGIEPEEPAAEPCHKDNPRFHELRGE